jgi:hypothetical protein
MQQRVHSPVALRTLLKFRTCAEGWLAREWTGWKPRSKTTTELPQVDHQRSTGDCATPRNGKLSYDVMGCLI